MAAPAQTLSTVVLLNTNAAEDCWEDRDPSMATDGKGNWIVAWETLGDLVSDAPGSDQDIAFIRSTRDADTWTRPALLAPWQADDRGADSSPVVATDARGNWVVAWQSMGTIAGRDSDILFVHSSDVGRTWSKPAPIVKGAASDSAQDFHPSLVALPDGTWLAAWESSADIGGSGRDFDIHFARSTDGGRHWSEPRPLDPDAGRDRDGDRKVTLAADSKGVVVAAWEAFSAKGGGLGTDWDVVFSRSTDSGQTWSPSSPLSRFAAEDGGAADQDVVLAADGGGLWVAAWSSTFVSGAQPGPRRVWKVVSEDGGATWGEPGPLIDATGAGPERSPSVAVLAGVGFVFAAEWAAAEDKGRAPSFCVLADPRGPCPLWKPAVGIAGGEAAEGAPRVVAGGGWAALVWSGDHDWTAAASRDTDLRLVRLSP